MPKYRGADWLEGGIGVKEVSSLGTAVADLLGDVYEGIYHLNYNSLRKVKWSDPDYIEVTVRHGLATWDYNELTRLVVLCHDRLLRCAVHAAAPGYLKLCFSQREGREGSTSRRHPTIEHAVESIRAFYARPEA